MTDICSKALDFIDISVKLSQNLTKPDVIALKELAWGRHEDEYWQSMQGQFDLILASDVVYLPECVDPLIESVKFFLKPGTGKCLMVNAFVRCEAFLGQLSQKCDSLGINLAYDPDIEEDPTDKSKRFKVSLMTVASQKMTKTTSD